MLFRPSEGTVGVEYELHLVDAQTLDLVDGASAIAERFSDTPHVKPELIQSTIEITTPVCDGIAGVARTLRGPLAEVRAVGAELGMRLVGAGTHPFSQRLATVTPSPRYARIGARTALLSTWQITCALQVHVGMASSGDAVAAMRDLRCFLPVLVALSASSPFWYGHDTGFAAWRVRVLATNPSYGVPPRFEDWGAVETFFETSTRAGMLQSWRDIHWDIRPRPDYGTIELRVMDTSPTVTEAVALAAFARALTTYLLRTPASRRPRGLPRPLPSWLEAENHFQASRLALAAPYVSDSDPAVRPLREVFDATLEAVAPIATELGDGAFLEPLAARIMRAPSYLRQREVHQATQSLRAVVSALADELDADLDGR